MDKAEKILIIVACAALLGTLFARGCVGWQSPTKAALADQEDIQDNAAEMELGDSGAMDNPIGRAQLANTRFVRSLPGMPAPLRQSTRGGIITAQIMNG